MRIARLLFLLALTGCDASDHVVIVDLATDLLPGVEFDTIIVRLDGLEGVASAQAGVDYLDGVRVAELTVPSGSTHVLEVELRDAVGLVATRRAEVPGAPLSVITMLITRDCRGVRCGDVLTCIGGLCSDPACVAGDEDECELECFSSGDCPALDACARRRCELGLCVYEAEPGGCGNAEVCVPESGCRALVPPIDGGPPDAGAADAGPLDAGPRDGGPLDAGPPDAGPECLIDDDCAANQRCRAGACGPYFDCTPAVGDGDGDGIPDARDPWPARCNALIDFQRFPSFTAAWTSSGSVTAEPTGSLVTPPGRLLSTTTDARYFIEASFELREITDVDSWTVDLFVRTDGNELFACHLYRQRSVDEDPRYTGMGPRLRLGYAADTIDPGIEGDFGLFPETAADMSAGRRYTLQFWVSADGSAADCRLANDAGLVGRSTTTRDYTFDPPPDFGSLAGQVRLGGSNRSAVFERVLITGI